MVSSALNGTYDLVEFQINGFRVTVLLVLDDYSHARAIVPLAVLCQFVSNQGEMLCHIVLTTCNSLRALLNTNRFAFQELMQETRQIELSGTPTANAQRWSITNINFDTSRICRVYENTREPDCKGVKEGEALRRVRTGAGAGLAR